MRSDGQAGDAARSAGEAIVGKGVDELFEEFFRQSTGRGLDDVERGRVRDALRRAKSPSGAARGGEAS